MDDTAETARSPVLKKCQPWIYPAKRCTALGSRDLTIAWCVIDTVQCKNDTCRTPPYSAHRNFLMPIGVEIRFADGFDKYGD